MSDHTKIEWTNATWNPITGCSVFSAGCKHCYAMRLAGTRLRHHPSRAGLTRETSAGPVWTGAVRLNEHWLDQPLRWKKPRRIFVCAHGDLFHTSVPFDWIDRVFAAMASAPQHTFQVLTKRPEQMREYLSGQWRSRLIPHLRSRRQPPPGHGVLLSTVNGVLPNVHLGVSVENQETADERIQLLLDTPAAVRFVSAEPMLGPVDLTRWLRPRQTPNDDGYGGDHAPGWTTDFRAIDWVICGGESGPGARPCDAAWIREIIKQCREAHVPCFVKQLGAKFADSECGIAGAAWRRDAHHLGLISERSISAPIAYLRSPSGSDPTEWPADLRVGEFPRSAP